MSTSQQIPVKSLHIDLKNYRTVPQPNEVSALHSMITTSPDKFWALLRSLLENGFIPNENIIILKNAKGQMVVAEGNRRVGCLKLIHGLIKDPAITLPVDLAKRIAELDVEWKKQNSTVPCVVYEPADAAAVDKIVALTHGKAIPAGRDPWGTVARARHNRDKNGASEPGLDLLEKFLKNATNCSQDQKERWAGSYFLTVLDEALKKFATRFGFKTGKELAAAYPSVPEKRTLDEILRDIGLEVFGFHEMREEEDYFFEKYGLVDPAKASSGGTTSGGTTGGGTTGGGTTGGGTTGGGTAGGGTADGGTTGGGTAGGGTGKRGANKTPAIEDPKSIKRMLKNYAPRGADQHKLATLVAELKNISVEKTPHAFCFVLRSIFEVAAKQYANSHSISLTKGGGKDKTLLDLLRDATNHLTHGKPPMDPLVKKLHGSMQELANVHGFLSVTSMNQLVHNPHFSIKPADICRVFHNVFPLLDETTR